MSYKGCIRRIISESRTKVGARERMGKHSTTHIR
nr:MAG TPA: hypothetical protein [Caudoviricetes sp.]